MKKTLLFLAIMLVISLAYSDEIEWEEISRGMLDVKTAVIDSTNPKIIYIGAKGGVFKTEDKGGSWRNILLLRGEARVVNLLYLDPQEKNSLYAATGSGLFFSSNAGKNWRRIFKGRNYLQNDCSSLLVSDQVIYLGTKEGLFISQDKGRSWHKASGELGKSRIFNITNNAKELKESYIACVNGVYRSTDSGKSWPKIFVANPTENGDDTEEVNEDRDEEERFSEVRYITLDPNEPRHIYLATTKGVKKSNNKGEEWESLPSYGLLDEEIKFILVLNKREVYAATRSGIFEYKDERWQELSFGLVCEQINSLILDSQDNLYACGNRGLFRVVLSQKNYEDVTNIYSNGEPKISQVQQAAIQYAEVEPQKIIKWRNLAAKKALLPEVSLGVDRNTTDLWHWESGSSTKSDDDILRRGDDSIDWSVTLSWDLGDLIWNNDQTSIDVRSRLMVQLRDDILDEVTKIYFERLRVKMELNNLAIEDRKKRFEKELRLQELTASLDALTGGYFSRQIKMTKNNSS